MAATTSKTAKEPAKRDAYDDFLDGVDISAAKKSAKSASGAKKSSGTKSGGSGKNTSGSTKSKNAGSAETGKKASSGASKTGKASSGGKSASSGRKTSARKVTDIEEGIVSLGARQAAKPVKSQTAKAASSSKTSGKTSSGTREKTGGTSSKPASGKSTSKRRNTAVLALDNPVAFIDPWEEPVRKTPARKTSAARTTRVSPKPAEGHAPKTVRSSRKSQDDIFLENPPKRRNSGNRNSGRKKGSKRPSQKWGGMDIFFSAGIVCILALILWQGTQYSNFKMMKNAVDRQTFYQGTTVEGIDVSGMTLDAALEYWQNTVEPRYAGRTVNLDNGQSITAAELGYASDYAMVLSNAWSAGRSGSLEERYQAISSRQETPVAYTVSRTAYNVQAIENFVVSVAKEINTPAKEAGIESFDTRTFKFVFSDPQPGKTLDHYALRDSIMQAFDAGGGNVQMVIKDVAPVSSKESVASKYGMITSAITNASSSSKNRLTNIKLSLSLINGTCLKPGETFSFNGVVGERTSSRGFKSATAYSSGEVTEQVGGGICQVSTTLFNAAVKADLKIVERHNHSLTVGYVDKGKDAAVNWGSQDLRFTNNTDDNIYICCYLTDDKRVRFGIFGKLLPNGETITLEGVTTGTIDYEIEYQESGLLGPGEQVVMQSGKKGYTAEAYKIRWDAKGNQISRELLCKSKYKAAKEIIQVGPAF